MTWRITCGASSSNTCATTWPVCRNRVSRRSCPLRRAPVRLASSGFTRAPRQRPSVVRGIVTPPVPPTLLSPRLRSRSSPRQPCVFVPPPLLLRFSPLVCVLERRRLSMHPHHSHLLLRPHRRSPLLGLTKSAVGVAMVVVVLLRALLQLLPPRPTSHPCRHPPRHRLCRCLLDPRPGKRESNLHPLRPRNHSKKYPLWMRVHLNHLCILVVCGLNGSCAQW
mmetsp:Transcript_7411/g.22807  ORF Transcript_7411/g.22807 Transcript_7411/m.22807 type:complete len:222 (+) Transcript_7411:2974-3639(+)